MPGPGAFWIGEEEKKEALEVLESGYLFRYGDLDDPAFAHKTFTLESEFAEYIGVPRALATCSGTCSLLVGLQALGVGPGDEVIVPAYTFVAGFSTVLSVGAVPILCEIDESLNIDPTEIEKRLSPRTKAILPVHMLGNPCDMDPIMAIAAKHGLVVLEDACQACGASYKGRKVGSIGQMGAFSLNAFKTITCGDGGLLATSDNDLHEKAFGYHDQGHSPLRAGVEVGRRSIVGLDFRMCELSAAVALAQLRKIERILAALRERKRKFKERITGIDGVGFRKVNDEQGECATLLTVIFDDASRATKVAAALGTTTVDHSGWHVYCNMEHIAERLAALGQPHGKGAYPKTDDILSRSINLSVGVVDAGLGAGFGININSTDEEIEQAAAAFRAVC